MIWGVAVFLRHTGSSVPVKRLRREPSGELLDGGNHFLERLQSLGHRLPAL